MGYLAVKRSPYIIAVLVLTAFIFSCREELYGPSDNAAGSLYYRELLQVSTSDIGYFNQKESAYWQNTDTSVKKIRIEFNAESNADDNSSSTGFGITAKDSREVLLNIEKKGKDNVKGKFVYDVDISESSSFQLTLNAELFFNLTSATTYIRLSNIRVIRIDN